MDMIQFTSSQQKALDTFERFLESNEQVFLLKGAAGTGKTTVVSEFIKTLEKLNRRFYLMAPTGRAAYIISNKTGKAGTTIHRGIYAVSTLKSTGQNRDEDSDDGGLHVKFGLKLNNDHLDTVYIVDEASMISDSFSENEAFSFGSGRLLSDLFEFASGRKLIFVGDYAQLPPVGMNFSPALDGSYLSEQFHCKTMEFKLREVIRQADGSCILVNANRIRDSIDNKVFIEFKLDNGNDFISENDDLLAPYFSLSSSKPCVRAAVIAYSNRQALLYNLGIRKHYFGEDAPRLREGDLLLIARNNYAQEVELFNGNIVQVESCQPDEEVQSRLVRVKLGKDRIESVELKFRKATIRFAVNGKAVSLNVVILDNFLDDPSSCVGGLLARALIVDFNNRLPQHIKSRLGEIRKCMRSKNDLTPDQKRLCETYIKLLQLDPYYNAVICKYGYAMTCHKAQGGEWDNVFVDMCRFGGTANEDYFRWAYTALTRASKRIWHFRSPDFNYISSLVVEQVQKSNNLKVSTYSENSDFLGSRFERIRALAKENEITVTEDKSINYQHRITFSDSEGHISKFTLWYNNKGYSNKDILLKTSSEDLKVISQCILEESYMPTYVPFNNHERPFAEKLVSFFKGQFEEIGIRLLDITTERYQDVFHVKASGYAKICLYYAENGNYTHMRLISSLGQEDELLERFRQQFI